MRLVPALPRGAWLVLSGDTLSAIGSGLTLPFFIVYLHRVRGFGLEVAGLAQATTALASLAGNPCGGFLTDRVGARRAVVTGLFPAAIGAAGVAFVTRPWEAFAAATVLGFGTAVFFPAFDSLLAVTVRPEQRSAAFAVRHATLNAGFAIGGLVAAAIVDFSSPRTFQLLYLIDAASSLAFAPLLLLLKGVGDRPAEDESLGPAAPAGYGVVLRDRVFLRLAALTVLLFALGYAQMNAAFPPFVTGPGGISAGQLGIAFAANTLAVVFLQLPVLRLAQGRRRTTALVFVFSLWAVTWAVTLVAGDLLNGAAALGLFVTAAVIFALGETLMSPAMQPLVNDLASDRLRGRYNAVYTLSLTTGYIVGPAVAGLALGSGHATAFFAALIVGCVASALAALRLRAHVPAGLDVIGGLEAEPPVPVSAPTPTGSG